MCVYIYISLGINICIYTLRKDSDQGVSHRRWWEKQELKGGSQRGLECFLDVFLSSMS